MRPPVRDEWNRGPYTLHGGREDEERRELERENEALRDRLSRLSQANLRINESLDFETVLQGVLDSACSLTGARYGVIALVGASGRIEDSVTSGLTLEEHRRFKDFPEGFRSSNSSSRFRSRCGSGTSKATRGRWACPVPARPFGSSPLPW